MAFDSWKGKLMNQEDKNRKQDEKREQYYQKIVDRMSNNHKDEWSEQEENESNKHPGEYYCGICGWVPIKKFPHCH
jgi:hypothetical protein